MNQDIRYAVFAMELFLPLSNMGQGIESLILSSEHLEKFSAEEIEAELQLMKSEGLIDQRDPDDDPKHDAWWSTEKGQREVQKLKATLGYRSSAMANQGKHSSADLILALFAAPKVSEGFHYAPHSRKALGIYLFEKDAQELATATEGLISDGYLSTQWEATGLSGPTLTAKGLQHYKKTVHGRLGLDDGQSILDAKQALQLDVRFEKIGLDPKLVSNLQMRWLEAQRAKDANAYLASVTMLGSILEGLLYASFQKDLSKPMTAAVAPRDKTTGSIKTIDKWDLQEMINVAVEIGLVSKAVSKHSQELRDSRNLIHPRKQVAEGFDVDEGLLRISFEVVSTVLESLLKAHAPGAP